MGTMDQTPSAARPETATWSDEQLLAAWREADSERRRELADRLFERYYERVARWCLRSSGERDSAADLAQEVFLKAHRHLERFQGTSQFGTWLYSIVRNEAINRSKRRGPPNDESSEEILIHLPSTMPRPDQLAEESSRARRVRQLLATTLDETERTVFTLHYGDDMPLDAIGRLLNLENRSGAKAFIVSAKRKLARAVERISARGERL
jgi:RNA polymerase sigma-70 factor (ECF subfamily)